MLFAKIAPRWRYKVYDWKKNWSFYQNNLLSLLIKYVIKNLYIYIYKLFFC